MSCIHCHTAAYARIVRPTNDDRGHVLVDLCVGLKLHNIQHRRIRTIIIHRTIDTLTLRQLYIGDDGLPYTLATSAQRTAVLLLLMDMKMMGYLLFPRRVTR